MTESTDFSPGQIVAVRSDPSLRGAVVEVLPGEAEDRVKVFVNGNVRTRPKATTCSSCSTRSDPTSSGSVRETSRPSGLARTNRSSGRICRTARATTAPQPRRQRTTRVKYRPASPRRIRSEPPADRVHINAVRQLDVLRFPPRGTAAAVFVGTLAPGAAKRSRRKESLSCLRWQSRFVAPSRLPIRCFSVDSLLTPASLSRAPHLAYQGPIAIIGGQCSKGNYCCIVLFRRGRRD